VIRLAGGIDCLLALLARRSSNEKLNRRLLVTLSNLVTLKLNRRMFHNNALKDLIALLHSESDNIKEPTLRTLMNITVEREYEDKVREVGGLPVIISIMENENSSENVRLQAIRLLVNLVWNIKNKDVMLQHGLLKSTIEFLMKEPSEQFAIRLIRLLGYFSVNTPVDVYEETAATKCANVLVELMKTYKESSALAEAVAVTVSKITVPRESNYIDAMDEFKKEFLTAGDGIAVELLISLLSSDKSTYRYNALCALSNLARDCDLAIEKIKGVNGSVNTIRQLCSNDDPKAKDRAQELLKLVLEEGVD